MTETAEVAAAEKKTRTKSAKPLPGEDGFTPDHNGPQPHFPAYGDSWMDTDGKVKFWDGKGFYLNPPGAKGAPPATLEEAVEEINAETGKITTAELAAAAVADIDGPVSVDDAAVLTMGGEVIMVIPPADDDDDQSPAIIAMEAAATDFEFGAVRYLVADARDFLLNQIKVRPKPWGATSEAEQREIAAACDHAAEKLVRKLLEKLAVEDRQPIRALLENYAEKDGIKIALTVKSFNEEESLAAVVALHKARGKHVMITVASVDDYRGERAAETDPDQPDLGFEFADGDFEAGTDGD